MHHSLSPLIMTLNHDRVLELGWDGIDYQVLVSISYPTLSWPMIIQLVDQWSSNSTGFWTNRKDKYEGNLLPDPYSNSTVHSVATISLNCFNIINLQLSASISNWLKPNNSQPTAFWVASSRGGSQPWLFKLQVEITVTIDKNHGYKKIFRKFHLFDPPPGVWKFENPHYRVKNQSFCTPIEWPFKTSAREAESQWKKN